MGKGYLIDTNIAIYLLDGNMPTKAVNFLSHIIDNEYFMSVVSKMELLGFDFGDIDKSEIAEAFVNESNLLSLSDDVIDKTIELRKIKRIKLPDAIIAATAIIHNLHLISRNDKDFDKIPHLNFTNPYNF